MKLYKIILLTSLMSFIVTHIQTMQQPAIQLSPIALQFKQAIENQDLATIDALLNAGFDIEAPVTIAGSPALLVAAFYGHTEVVRTLLKRKANVNAARQDGATALFMATGNGHAASVHMLLQAGANVNATLQPNGATALIIAAQNGHDTIVHMLLQTGADVTAKIKSGSTALIIAAEMGHDTIVNMLLQAGANVNAKIKSGSTALVLASNQGYIKVVILLLLARARVNTQNNDGTTALQVAVQANHKTVISLLRAFGARNDIPNNDGKTPLDYAQSHEIRYLLKETPEEARTRVQKLIEGIRQELLPIGITPILRKREIGLLPTQEVVRSKSIAKKFNQLRLL